MPNIKITLNFGELQNKWKIIAVKSGKNEELQQEMLN